MSATTNPYRQPRAKSDIRLQCRIWNATPKGQDASSGNSQLVANDAFVWLGNDFSVPLQWLTTVRPIGPGFCLEWRDPSTGANESASFCIRTFFGYDTRRRDAVVTALRDLVGSADSAGVPGASAAASALVCETCGAPAVAQLNVAEVRNLLLLFSSKTRRHVVCPLHARSAVRAACFHNALLGSWGIPGIVTTPLGAWSIASGLPAVERVFWVILSAVPLLLLTAAVVFGASG